MLHSRLTQKGQATIPAAVRESLGLQAGDRIAFEINNNQVVISKIEPFDLEYHAAVSNTLSEWESDEDNEAFNDL